MRRWTWLSLPVLLLLLVSSCQGPVAYNNMTVVRRGRWWEFYRRGLHHAMGGDWVKAATDFEVAMGERAGAVLTASTETLRARTYGLHFQDDYFPHRELGVCFYHMGRLAEAEAELTQSIDMVPSSRAKHYLNVVRASLMRQASYPKGDGLELRSRLAGLPPGEELVYSNRATLKLEGTAQSGQLVSAIIVNGRPVLLELACEEFDLGRELSFGAGEHEVTVEAHDLGGNSVRWEQRLIVDLTGPSVSFGRTSDMPRDDVILVVRDDVGLVSVKLGGKPVTLGEAAVFEKIIHLTEGGRIEVEAADRAGNRMCVSRPHGDLLQASLSSRKHYPCNLRASAASTPAKRAEPDTTPPRLHLKPDVDESLAVTNAEFMLEVEMSDRGRLDSVSIACNRDYRKRSLRQLSCQFYTVAETLRLRPGANDVTVTVSDQAGNETRRQFTLNLKEAALLPPGLRMTAQVPEIIMQGIALPAHVDLRFELFCALQEDQERLIVVERDPEFLQRVLLELGLAMSSLSDSRSNLQTGKLRKAEWILQPRLSRWPGEEDSVLKVVVSDVDTAEPLFQEDIHIERLSRREVSTKMRWLVEKLSRRLPTASAHVGETEDSGVVIPLGEKDGVLPGMRFVFFPNGTSAPAGDDPIKYGEVWVQGRVVAVRQDGCLAKVFPAKARSEIRSGQLAALR